MYYAEHDTDKYIRENFFPDISYKGTMIEVGAGPAEFISMSKHFRDSGWRCVCIEPNPKFVNEHKRLNNEIYQYACSYEESYSTFKIVETSWPEETNGISYSAIDIKYPLSENHKIIDIPVEIISLNLLLARIGIDSIDFISVDTEGWELEVMEGFDIRKYDPKVVLLENYANNNEYIDYMESAGYKLKEKIKYNYIFTK